MKVPMLARNATRVRDFEDLCETSRERILELLRTDLNVALTFVDLADSAPTGSEKRSRNQHNAREAHDATIYWLGRLDPDSNETHEITAKFDELRARLGQLGETF